MHSVELAGVDKMSISVDEVRDDAAVLRIQ
jgi:hypothetical protein